MNGLIAGLAQSIEQFELVTRKGNAVSSDPLKHPLTHGRGVEFSDRSVEHLPLLSIEPSRDLIAESAYLLLREKPSTFRLGRERLDRLPNANRLRVGITLRRGSLEGEQRLPNRDRHHLRECRFQLSRSRLDNALYGITAVTGPAEPLPTRVLTYDDYD